jgi:type II secretory pathway component PulL
LDKQLWAATAVIVMSLIALIVSLISAMVYQTHHFEKHIDALRSEMNHRFDDLMRGPN